MPKRAIAIFGEFEELDSNIYGTTTFIQKSPESPVKIHVQLYDVPGNGAHGFHVHEKKITSALLRKASNSKKKCCDLLGGHYNGGKPLWSPVNPYGTPHGHHIGDLNFNVYAKNGNVDETFYDNVISLYRSSSNYIIGRSLVLHAKKDDKGKGDNVESLITGNAGSRLTCSNIVLTKFQ